MILLHLNIFKGIKQHSKGVVWETHTRLLTKHNKIFEKQTHNFTHTQTLNVRVCVYKEMQTANSHTNTLIL